MNLFTVISGWFHKESAALHSLFARIEPLVAEAEPIVKALSAVTADAAALDPQLAPAAAVMSSIAGYIQQAVSSPRAAISFVAANSGAPLKSVLLNAASLVLSKTTKTTATELSDFDTAAQLAYATVKEAAVIQ